MSTPKYWTAKMEPFDSFWEGPADIEQGYGRFSAFYRHNYLPRLPDQRDKALLVVSCGPGYFVHMLREQGYTNVLGIDSDAAKVQHATARKLPCETHRAWEFLEVDERTWDAIVCEQELNHLTKEEMIEFLQLCWRRLRPGGRVIVHGLNGANPLTGSEALAQNFDHYNTFTEYTLRQVLTYCAFEDVQAFPLNLYVFYANPMNYVAMAMAGLFTAFFRFAFILYGKSNKIFTKKIGGIGVKPADAAAGAGT